jgi:hypothetical protein
MSRVFKALQNITKQPKTYQHVFHKALHSYLCRKGFFDINSFAGLLCLLSHFRASEYTLPQCTTQYWWVFCILTLSCAPFVHSYTLLYPTMPHACNLTLYCAPCVHSYTFLCHMHALHNNLPIHAFLHPTQRHTHTHTHTHTNTNTHTLTYIHPSTHTYIHHSHAHMFVNAFALVYANAHTHTHTQNHTHTQRQTDTHRDI